ELRGPRGGRPGRGAGPQRAAHRPDRPDGGGRGDPAVVRRRVGATRTSLAAGDQSALCVGLSQRQRVGRRAQARPAAPETVYGRSPHEGDRISAYTGAVPMEFTTGTSANRTPC